MSATRARWAAAAAVVVTAAAGVVTNLITSKWSWTLAVVLAVLITCAAALAYLTTASAIPDGTRVTQRATRLGKILRSSIKARNGATIDQRATRGGTIEDSKIDTE